jgi:hypothetical protein
VSCGPGRLSTEKATGSGVIKTRLTSCGEGVIVRAQGEEEEERGEPDADGEERRHLSERGGLDYGPAAVGLAPGLVCLLREVREVEEPEEVVGNDEDARRDEGLGGEGDDGPCVGEVLQVDDVADDGEGELGRGERVCECEQDV